MSNMKFHERISVSNNTSIHAMIWKPQSAQIERCVIFSHGFSVSGYESRRMFLDIAERLVQRNIMCVLFDYRGSGYSDLDFSEMTINTEMEDLNAVISYVKEKLATNLKITVWGMSFGSGVASLVVSKRNDVNSLLLWCLSADLYNRYKKRFGEEIFSKGYVYTDRAQKVSLDFLNSLKEVDVFDSYKNIICPILFVHGDDDPIANVDLSHKAYELANQPKYIEIIHGGNHGFKLQEALFETAIEKSLLWLKNQ